MNTKGTDDIKNLGRTWAENWSEKDDEAFFRMVQCAVAASTKKDEEMVKQEKGAPPTNEDKAVKTTHSDKTFSMAELRKLFGLPDEQP